MQIRFLIKRVFHRWRSQVRSLLCIQSTTALRRNPPGYLASELMTPRSPGRYSPRSCFCSKQPCTFSFLFKVLCVDDGNRYFSFYVSNRAQLWGDTHTATQLASLWLPGHRVDIHLKAAFAPNALLLANPYWTYFASLKKTGTFPITCAIEHSSEVIPTRLPS